MAAQRRQDQDKEVLHECGGAGSADTTMSLLSATYSGWVTGHFHWEYAVRTSRKWKSSKQVILKLKSSLTKSTNQERAGYCSIFQ